MSTPESILQIVEGVMKTGWEVQIPVYITAQGIKVSIYRKSATDVSQEVYGPDAKDDGTKIGEVQALISGDEWTTFDFRSVGTFDKGWMYCLPADIANYNVVVGDVVKFVDRTDSKVRRYKIVDAKSIGHTVEVVKKFELSSLGD